MLGDFDIGNCRHFSELHPKFSFASFAERRWAYGGISLDQEEREADDGLTPSFMGLAGVQVFVMNDVRRDAL